MCVYWSVVCVSSSLYLTVVRKEKVEEDRSMRGSKAGGSRGKRQWGTGGGGGL